MRIGYGVDVHKLTENRKLVLGGVEVPYKFGLLGHSDADVLVHSIMDALLGATGNYDIGKHFPDNDDRFLNISSIILLKEVNKIIKKDGYKISNIDATIIAQSPKLAPYIDLMRENIADALEIEINLVNIKATTTERLGFAGRGEGIEAQAVCLVYK